MATLGTANGWIIFPQPKQGVRLRLFCFPYAGGGAGAFRLWPGNLPSDIEVCRIQLPGRENRLREPPFTRLSTMALELVQILHPYLDIPFVFFGHSIGALVSFEVARELRTKFGLRPSYLFASGYRAPQVPRDTPIYHLPDVEFVEGLQRRYDGIPKAVLQEPELMKIMLPILRADLTICDTYSYVEERPLGCPIAAFGGLEDSWVSHEHLEAWRFQTSQSFTLRMFPGNHFFLESAQPSLLEAISNALKPLISQLRASD